MTTTKLQDLILHRFPGVLDALEEKEWQLSEQDDFIPSSVLWYFHNRKKQIKANFIPTFYHDFKYSIERNESKHVVVELIKNTFVSFQFDASRGDIRFPRDYSPPSFFIEVFCILYHSEPIPDPIIDFRIHEKYVCKLVIPDKDTFMNTIIGIFQKIKLPVRIFKFEYIRNPFLEVLPTYELTCSEYMSINSGFKNTLKQIKSIKIHPILQKFIDMMKRRRQENQDFIWISQDFSTFESQTEENIKRVTTPFESLLDLPGNWNEDRFLSGEAERRKRHLRWITKKNPSKYRSIRTHIIYFPNSYRKDRFL